MTFSYYEEIMNAPQSIEFMVSTMNVGGTHTFCILEMSPIEKISDFEQKKCYDQHLWEFLFTGKRRYNIKLWKLFNNVRPVTFFFLTKVSVHYSLKCFNCLPVVAIINSRIFCCHGGNTWFFSHSMSTYFFIVWRSLTWPPQLGTNSADPTTDRCTRLRWGMFIKSKRLSFLEKVFMVTSNWNICSYKVDHINYHY